MVVGVLCHLDQPVSGSASGGTSHPCPGLRLPTDLFIVLVGEPCEPRLQAKGSLIALLVCGALRTPSWLKGEAGHLAVSGVWISQALHPDVWSGLLPTVIVL